MPDPFIPIAFTGFAGLILVLFARGATRDLLLRKRARERWKRTSGRVLEFGLTGNRPEVVYTYTIDGEEYQGSGIVLNKPTREGYTPGLKKRLYVDDCGRLRYPPGKSVEVYYDPDSRGKSALALEIGINWGAILIVGLVFAGALTALLKHLGVIDIPFAKSPLIGHAIVVTVSACLLMLTLRVLFLHLRSRDFSSVEGRVLEAEVQKGTGKGNSYTLAIRYEYEVEGVRYFSRQIYATDVTVSTGMRKIEDEAKALRENPKVRVWYDPRAPWKCHLRQGPLPMIVFLFCATIVFHVIAFKMLLK